MEEKYIITVSTDNNHKRLDQFLVDYINGNNPQPITRTRVQNLITSGNLYKAMNEGLEPIIQPSHKVKAGEIYELIIPDATLPEPQPQDIALDIVYEDKDVLVINKEAGMVVHPAPGNWDNTLVNALLAHCADSLSGIGGVKRPGIVHRLDKDTSGLMIIAKNDQAHQKLSLQFESRELSRKYMAITWGHFKEKAGVIDKPIGRSPHNRQKMAVVMGRGKPSITHYKVLQSFVNIPIQTTLNLVECVLKTGRTHQIRVHMTDLGHPLLGDGVYGQTPKGAIKALDPQIVNFNRQALHAYQIEFIHPSTGDTMSFSVPLPDDMVKILSLLESNS